MLRRRAICVRSLYAVVPLFALLVSGAALAVVYVDQNAPGPAHDGASWDTAFLEIQDGVDAATPGGEVWVADGVYVENVVMGEGVAIYGGFLGSEAGGYENSLEQRAPMSHVATINGNRAGSCVTMAADARIDGFTIFNGLAMDGGGVYCMGLGATGVIANNTITENWGDADGGGIFCRDSSPTIIRNIVSENGCGSYEWEGFGAGIYCRDSSAIIAYNTIIGNLAEDEFWGWGIGAGVYCTSASPTIVGNFIVNNDAAEAGGGIVCRRSAPVITNNTIHGNAADTEGGGIYCARTSSPIIVNNAVTSNSATDGGGIYSSDSSPTLTHNDFWDNAPDDYSGCGPGAGDISQDAAYADPANGDYHLAVGSSCIDVGDDAAPALSYEDFDGDPRVCDGDGDAVAAVDIGADELCGEYESNIAPADWFVPGWVWFSIPLDPRGSKDASDVLGFSCRNRLFGWDDAMKNLRLYPDDFTEIGVGPSYVARLAVGEQYRPVYEGAQPALPFGWTLPAAGWAWVGVPATQHIHGPDLRVAKGGQVRTAAQDKAAADPWVNWNWICWDPLGQSYRIMDPFGGGDDEWLHPWWGYRVWCNTEDVEIVFP